MSSILNLRSTIYPFSILLFNCFLITMNSQGNNLPSQTNLPTEQIFARNSSDWNSSFSPTEHTNSFEPTNSPDPKSSEVKIPQNANYTPKCQLWLENPAMLKVIDDLINVKKIALIQYKLNFYDNNGRAQQRPLKSTDTVSPDIWFRYTSEQGLILLHLYFNYDVLSLMTLSMSTHKLEINLKDGPPNCMQEASGEEQLESIKYAMLRDFKKTLTIRMHVREGVCREFVRKVDGKAIFGPECVGVEGETGDIVLTYDIDRFWLKVVDWILICTRLFSLFFGPYFFLSAFKGFVKLELPYIVMLKPSTFIKKNFLITNDKSLTKEFANKPLLDLNKESGFSKLKYIITTGNCVFDKPFEVQISQYDILVPYSRTQQEKSVNVGFFKCLFELIFRCKIREVGPFIRCCDSEMNRYFMNSSHVIMWITCLKQLAYVLLLLLAPFPYYLRLIAYYYFEHETIEKRQKYTEENGLKVNFDNSLIEYLTPFHPVLVIIYLIIVLQALVIAFSPHRHNKLYKNHIARRVVNSFRDLNRFSFVKIMEYFLNNLAWPFHKFGIFGCCLCCFYWIFALPLTFFICAIYSLPTFYLIVRFCYYCKQAIYVQLRKKTPPFQLYQVPKYDSQNKLLDKMKMEHLLERYDFLKLNDKDKKYPEIESIMQKVKSNNYVYKRADFYHCLTYILSTILSILATICLVILVSEVIVYLIQMLIFTIMGIMVNAGFILRHVMVVAIVILYCFDSFNNVYKKYMKLNKTLFLEVTRRIKDLEKVTSLPSFLQENRGFKSQELNEQAFYENEDNLATDKQWQINDLVLFMDSEDTPRIPSKLFEEACSIKVPGLPGPVYMGLLDAIYQLGKVMFFVLLVFVSIMIFSEVYSVSSTNQLIATVAGSFLPLILRSCLFQQDADIEANTVTFKIHLDELIKNFKENWPMYDLVFQIPDTRLNPKSTNPTINTTNTSSNLTANNSVNPNISAFNNNNNPPNINSNNYPTKSNTTNNTKIINSGAEGGVYSQKAAEEVTMNNDDNINNKLKVVTRYIDDTHSNCSKGEIKQKPDVDLVILIPTGLQQQQQKSFRVKIVD